jgi:DNA-binding transcriptional LysR family regulator
MARRSSPAAPTPAVAPAPAGRRAEAARRPIDLAGLRGFEAVARHLSFTRAAEELHRTQSAVSRQVASLEHELGHRLFVRKTRALELSAAGERLLRAVRQALNLVDRSVDAIRGTTTAPRVMLTTYASFASLWLVPRLGAFQRTHPDIELRINTDSRRLDLEAEGVDLALRRCPPAEAPRGAVCLFDEDVTPALGAELLNRHGGRLQSPADLLRLPLIEMDDDAVSDSDPSWARWFAYAGLPAASQTAAPLMVVSYIDQSMQAAARGQGVVLARKPFREEMVAARQLVLPFPELRMPTGFSTYLVASQGTRHRPAVAALSDWLVAEAARPAPRRD